MLSLYPMPLPFLSYCTPHWCRICPLRRSCWATYLKFREFLPEQNSEVTISPGGDDCFFMPHVVSLHCKVTPPLLHSQLRTKYSIVVLLSYYYLLFPPLFLYFIYYYIIFVLYVIIVILLLLLLRLLYFHACAPSL